MKIQPRQIESFIAQPDPAVRVILVYGPDEGKMRDRAARLGRGVVADLNDPFNVAVLSAAILDGDPARLSDEANAMSMMGGARLIRVEGVGDGAGDKATPALKAYLDNPSPTNLVVVEAGDLPPRSALRKLVESAPNAAAIPCYAASTGDVQALIRQHVQAVQYAIDPDASAWLSARLTGDHAIAMGELGKLTLYVSDQPPGYRISLNDVQLCCGSGSDTSLDELIFATGGGQPEKALRSFRQLIDEGMALIVIQRSLQNHFRRLHLTRSLMAAGRSQAEAMNSLNPKIFFKWEDAFRAQINRWSIGALSAALNRLGQIEAQSKQTGTPAETLTAQAILSLSARR